MFQSFMLDRSIIPASIYDGTDYQVSETGVVLPASIRTELAALLVGLIVEAEMDPAQPGIYLRVDAYLGSEGGSPFLTVLEVNADFVDGWGIALNLARAAGMPVSSEKIGPFPQGWATEEEVYLPELLLAIRELNAVGIPANFLPSGTASGCHQPVYCYGRGTDGVPCRYPSGGAYLDDKIWLARLSRTWMGSRVRIPSSWYEETPFDSLPANVVFKSRKKDGGLGRQVHFRDEIGKGKAVRRAYGQGLMVAQEIIPAFQLNEHPTQLVVLCNGPNPVTGYVQFADHGRRSINDNSVHGPLVFGF